jgi:hypothetical protein
VIACGPAPGLLPVIVDDLRGEEDTDRTLSKGGAMVDPDQSDPDTGPGQGIDSDGGNDGDYPAGPTF